MSSVNPGVNWCICFNQGRIRQQRERNGLRISYSLSKIHWASSPHYPGLHIGLFDIQAFQYFSQEYADSFILVVRAHVLFIVSCSYHVTVINFSVFGFYIIVY